MVNAINILTQQIAWKDQFSQITSHRFTYSDFDCTPLQLFEICKNEEIDVVICFDYEIQTKFSSSYASVVVNLGIPWLLPTPKASEMENKYNFYRWMEANRLPQYLPQSKNLHQFPYFIKIGNGYSAEYVHFIKDEQDLKKLNFKYHICQEYVPGDEEYVHHFIAINGRCIWQKTYKHIFAGIIKDKEPYVKGRGLFNKKIQKCVLNVEHAKIIEDIVAKIEFTGAGCIDFKIYKNKLFIFEFNSRTGGSLFYFDNELKDLDDFLVVYKNCVLR